MQETLPGGVARPGGTYPVEQRWAARRRTQRLRAIALWGAVFLGAAWMIVFGASVLLG
ncbi:MAG: hypothetical protein WCB51_14490 [Candidatus Dormiibacterota bacterium]